LQIMLGNQDVWQRSPESEDLFRPKVDQATDADIYSNPDEDEMFLSAEHRIGGRLEDAIGYNQGKEIQVVMALLCSITDCGGCEVDDFPRYNLEIGHEAPEGELFCTFKALTQYPYNYICTASRERVVKEFFAKGTIYDRVWDLCVIISSSSVASPSASFHMIFALDGFSLYLIHCSNLNSPVDGKLTIKQVLYLPTLLS